MNRLPRAMYTAVRYWLPAAAVATVLAGLVYLAVQSALRQGANDPQIEMAEDAAAQLAAGQPVDAVVPTRKVDMARSLAPYLIVYDAAGHPIAASVELAGQTPTLPDGVLDHVHQHGEDRVTWQPARGVRSATVITEYRGAASGFVLAGRSLREVEKREDDLMLEVAAAWAAGLALALVIAISIAAVTEWGSRTLVA